MNLLSLNFVNKFQKHRIVTNTQSAFRSGMVPYLLISEYRDKVYRLIPVMLIRFADPGGTCFPVSAVTAISDHFSGW